METLEQSAVPEDEQLKSVYTTDDQKDCVSVCRMFIDADIPFKVIQNKHQDLKGIIETFAIGVPPGLCGQAEQLLRIRKSDFDENQPEMELADNEELFTPEIRIKTWNPNNWYSEDATINIWSENAPEHAWMTWMIEMCLRENFIHARTEVPKDGSTIIFVLPEDESRAREIVREIVDGTPPT
ncbi:MAG TPA: hypothetical protein VGH37_12100 [Candidatus Acidoferrum sp.]